MGDAEGTICCRSLARSRVSPETTIPVTRKHAGNLRARLWDVP